MHFCCLVFTREKPTTDAIIDAMAPFEEEKYYHTPEAERDPKIPFLYDYYGYGGRFPGVLAMIGETEEQSIAADRVTASLQEPLNVDYIAEKRCFCFVDTDGKGYAMRRFDFRKEKWIRDRGFVQRLKKTFETRRDCYVTVIDIHD